MGYIGTDDYKKHKEARFVCKDKAVIIAKNAAFNLTGVIRETFKKRYEATKPLYYNGQPPFDKLLARIHQNIERL